MSKEYNAAVKHREIMERADEAAISDFENRRQALDDLRFRANENGIGQWDPLVYQERIDQGRPIATVNLIPQYIHQVTNEARNNKPAIKVRPVDDDADPETADVIEGIVRHIEDISEAASKAYIPALDNAATCGIGNFRVNARYCADNPWDKQELVIEGIPNAMAVLYDPLAKDPTRMDGNYAFVIDDMARSEFEKKYPDAVVSDFVVSNNHAAMLWWDTDTVRVAEYWCKEPYDRVMAKTQDGSILDITDVPKSAIQFLPPHQTRKVKSHKIVQYIVSGREILEGPNEWKGKYIPIIPVIGEETWVGPNRIRSGLVRNAKDPQRLYNLWRSNQMELIGLQPKSPFIATFKQVEKYLPLWKQANRRNLPYLPYDADPAAPGPPQRSQPPVASQGMAEEIALAASEMRSTTGIYASGLGEDASNAKSGRAIGALQKQGDIATLHFADNNQLSIRHCGRILVDLIPYYWDTEQTVRLLNEDGSNKFEKINSYIMTQGGIEPVHDLSVGTYDVTVTTGPSYATRRMEASDAMLQFIQTAPDAAKFVMDLIAKNQDWPGHEEIAKRFRMLLQKTNPEFFDEKDGEQPPPPTASDQMNALMAQLDMKLKQAETRKTEAEADQAEMEATQTAVETEAMASTHQMEIEAAVLTTLQKVILQGQQTMQPAQPGQGGNAQMPQPAAPAGA